ncbi:hypothetical protein BCR41DRAFT_318784 [Lobosporangium transversale]|uniref:Uncharacterized protein n=1 Tax=Lobosporangium transversale TaxID=64571 RepID=A0A1Y2GWN9_9FUNG|nr:hypothetical protein BCR41DRAFT_318784 [Lobosporangium transversale]ORZ26716.1 hypothetical protein BCR41DRAFT_318784 [Lobosporangium transversale]|eukprot:XP_021884479.1 hypothetical protein BCR41DRAFT_318784 [Lobosporangium transversale]
MASISAEFQALGQSLQNLRNIKGHWDGGESNPAVDNFNGEKHQTLMKLGEYFGKPGTPAADILTTMGQPDEIRQSMDEAFHASLMPGPVVGGTGGPTASANVMYFIYKWRGNHDYLWFKVDATTEKVLESSWYHAYE